MSSAWKVRQIRESVRLRGIRGPGYSGEYQFWCPFCEVKGVYMTNPDDFKGTLRVSGTAQLKDPDTLLSEDVELAPDRGVFNCWRCKTHGVGDFSWIVDVAELPEAGSRAPEHPGPPEDWQRLTGHPRFAPYVAYLRGRGVLQAAIEAGAGACLQGRKYHGRIVVPHLEAGAWRGFVARTIDPENPDRYRTPRGMPRRKMLWNGERLAGAPEIWVVEGVFDALALWPHAVATYGTGVSEEQLQMLSVWPRVVVAFDGEAAEDGRLLAFKLKLRGVASAWCRLPVGEDPGKIGWKVREYLVSG